MLPRLGQRLAASPKQGHFDKFDEWKNEMPAIFAENCARALPYQGGPVRFSENIRRPALLDREMPAEPNK
jgi:hypothetical protein